MDIISFNEASTANGRIESFIENPDSTSGIVTVPKVIASGETVTIPAGRIAVLPNVQVDGVLNVEGEVFIPSGATLGDLDAQLALKAPLVNPAFTNPTATTQAAQDNSTKVATTAYVDGKMVRATAVTASGTAVDFTNIPSWVKRITVMFDGVSTNGSSLVQVQVGSGTVQTTGYVSSAGVIFASSANANSYTSGMVLHGMNLAGDKRTGHLVFTRVSGNSWACSFVFGNGASGNMDASCTGGGSVALSAALDRIRITTVNGTDSFDAGQINIMYEG